MGRIVIDWDVAGAMHCVDVAVLPDARGMRVSLALLETWLEVADALDWRCTLQVLAENPAVRLYRRLEFVEAPGQDPADPIVNMVRF